jgi:hypothetical protein
VGDGRGEELGVAERRALNGRRARVLARLATLAAAFATLVHAASPTPAAPAPAAGRASPQSELQALRAERARLQTELRATLADDARLVAAPGGGVLVGVPTSLVRRLVRETVTGPLSRTRLDFGDIHLKKRDEIETRKLGMNITLGFYDLQVDVKNVVATLRAGEPKLTFGAGRIAIDAPVRVEGGRARGTVSFKWDGRNVTGLLCGDLSGTHELEATIPSLALNVRGRFDIAAISDRVVARPVFAPIVVNFKVQPPQKTWDFLDTLIQSRNGVCESAIRRARVTERIREAVSQTFRAEVPRGWARPVSMPAGFEQEIYVRGQRAGLRVVPTGVSITKDRVWYGGNVRAGRAAPDRPR